MPAVPCYVHHAETCDASWRLWGAVIDYAKLKTEEQMGMTLTNGIRVNAPGVIGEVLDGEAIIVNLDTGAYYSLDGAGATVWTAAQAGTTLDAVIKLTADYYQGDVQEIAAGVGALVDELLSEGLLVADKTVVDSSAGPQTAATPAADRPQFRKPGLHKYTDMTDLLLLDPIHEVDETGWPHAMPSK